MAPSESINAAETIYLASPSGQRYKVGAVPSGTYLADWSAATMDLADDGGRRGPWRRLVPG